MKVVHITPTYLDDSSITGGGERYPTELALHMSKIVDTTLVSFSSSRQSYSQGNLKIEVYPVKYFLYGVKANPLSFQYLSSSLNADIVHVHQINTVVSDIACLAAFLHRKHTFVTDHGGGGGIVLNRYLPVFKFYRNLIAQSYFVDQCIPPELKSKLVLIKGGIDTNKFFPNSPVEREKKILYVGRILPHKGINYLIEAFRLLDRSNYKLTILGRVYSEQFYQDIKQLAEGLPVEFIHDADDRRLVHEYRTACVTVLPSVHTDCYGNYTPVPELMGFTLLESQACGTPTICTDAGAMHEFVDDGNTGFVVMQNSGEAIASALRQFLSLSPTETREYQTRCRDWVQPLSWTTVVQKHLEVYQQ